MSRTYRDKRKFEAKHSTLTYQELIQVPWTEPYSRLRWGGIPPHYYSHRIRRKVRDALRHGNYELASSYRKRIKTGYSNR